MSYTGGAKTKLPTAPELLSNPTLNPPGAIRVTTRVPTDVGVVVCVPAELLNPAQKTPVVFIPFVSAMRAMNE